VRQGLVQVLLLHSLLVLALLVRLLVWLRHLLLQGAAQPWLPVLLLSLLPVPQLLLGFAAALPRCLLQTCCCCCTSSCPAALTASAAWLLSPAATS
jgi:hypothetical protein